MQVQYMFDETGKKTAAVVPIEEWEAILENLKIKQGDFWDELPEHVKKGIERGREQAAAGNTRSHAEVMANFTKYQ